MFTKKLKMKSQFTKNILIFLFFLFFYLLRLYFLPRLDIPQGKAVKIRGLVTQQTYHKDSKQIIRLGPVFISTNLYPGYFYGDWLLVTGSFKETVINPFYSQYYASFPAIQLEKADSGLIGKTVLTRFLLKARGQIENRIKRFLPENESGLLLGVLLGVKTDLPENFWQSLRKTGTLHLIVASGQNVVFVASIIISLGLLFLSRKKALVLTLVFIFLYVLMAGGEAPVVRAGLMVGLAFSSQFFGREGDSLRFLLISGSLMLLISPLMLFDIGFQLSFSSVLAIIFLYPRLRVLFGLDNIEIKPIRFFLDGFIVSLSAWLGTLGLILYHFRIFSPITVIANIFIVPLATVITLAGFSLVSLGFVAPMLAHLCAHTCELIIVLLLTVNSLLAKIPGASFNLSRTFPPF